MFPVICPRPSVVSSYLKVLNAREPKIVNGPEILDKYVGESEGKIRALFVDAEKEQVCLYMHLYRDVSICKPLCVYLATAEEVPFSRPSYRVSFFF